MARSIRARIETRSARLRLSGRKEPYWQKLERGLSAGYHRPRSGSAGAWWGRVLVGARYRIEALATADDYEEANGETILNWSHAQAAIRTWAARQTGGGPYTVTDACRDYITDLQARKGDRAARGAEGRINKHLVPVLGEHRLADLTVDDLIRWRNSMVDLTGDEDTERRSRDTANRVLSVVKAVLNYAFAAKKAPDDTIWRRVKPFKAVGEARKVFLTEPQQQNLIDACGPGLRELALFVAWTGARPGRELTDARVRDLDLDAGTLAVTGKTGRREVHLPVDALKLSRQLASGKRPDERLLDPAPGMSWRQTLHDRRIAAVVEKAGLDPATTLYALRHSYISSALKAGVPTKAVADQCGTSIRMIERYYAKLIPSDLAKYAQTAAPKLRVDVERKVVALRATNA